MTEKTDGGEAAAEAQKAAGEEQAEGQAGDKSGEKVGEKAGEKAGDIPAWKKNLPEQFQDDTPEGALAKAIDGWKGARDKMRQGVPEKIEDYGEIALSDAAKAAFGEIKADDPVLAAAKTAALEAGMTKAAWEGFVPKMMDLMVEGGLAPDTLDPDAEIKALGGADRATERRTGLNTWLTGLQGQNRISEAAVKEAQLVMTTAAGVELLEFMRKSGQETGVDFDGEATSGGRIDEKKLTEMRKDPRYRTDSPKHDPAYRKEVDALSAEFHKRQGN